MLMPGGYAMADLTLFTLNAQNPDMTLAEIQLED
jgi:hypothetical protein